MKQFKTLIIFLVVWFVFTAIAGPIGRSFGIPVDRETAYMDLVAAVVPVLFLVYLSLRDYLQCRRRLHEKTLQPFEKRAYVAAFLISLIRNAIFLAGVLAWAIGAHNEHIKPIPMRGTGYFIPVFVLFGIGVCVWLILEVILHHFIGNRITDLEAETYHEELIQDENLRLYQPDPVLRKRIWKRVRWRMPVFWIGMILQAGFLVAGGWSAAVMFTSVLKSGGNLFENAEMLYGALMVFFQGVLFSMMGVIIRRSVDFSKYKNEVVWINQEGEIFHTYDLFKGSIRRAQGRDNPTGYTVRSFHYDSVEAVSYDCKKEYLVFHAGHSKRFLFGYFDRWEQLFGETQTIFRDKMIMTEPVFWILRSVRSIVIIPALLLIFFVIMGIAAHFNSEWNAQKFPWYGKIKTKEIREELDSIGTAKDIPVQPVMRDEVMEYIRADFAPEDGVIYYKEIKKEDIINFVVWTQNGEDVFLYQYQKTGDEYTWILEMKSDTLKKTDVEGSEDGTL